MKKCIIFVLLVAILTLPACTSSGGVDPAQATSSDQVETIVAATIQAYASITPTATPAPVCPSEIEGTLLFMNEEQAYCLLHPAGYAYIIPYAGEVCFVPGEPPYLACHSASLFINVEEAHGRTAEQAADDLVAQAGFEIERSRLTLANEAAVVLDNFPGQASSRKVLLIHAGHLYTLTFIISPNDDGDPQTEIMENIYSLVTGSFVFLR